MVDLQNYFEGNNISFSVQPNNSYAYVEPALECSNIQRDTLGLVVSSKFIQEAHLLAVICPSFRHSLSPSLAGIHSPIYSLRKILPEI